MTAPVASNASRVASRLRLVVASGTIGLVAISWPLWASDAAFPRVPWLSAWPPCPAFVDLGLTLLALLGLAAWGLGIGGRAASAMVGIGLGLLIAGDQSRLQAWIYQSGLLIVALNARNAASRVFLARIVFIALYVHSGLSKLDGAFATGQGPVLLSAGFRSVGSKADAFPWFAPLVMPAVEVAVGVGLAIPSWRRSAAVAALVVHMGILLMLGPWGLGHGMVVLAWNVLLAVEVFVLFMPAIADRIGPWLISQPSAWLIGLAALLPIGERWGYWDAWPGFAVYSDHGEQLRIELPRADLPFYPASIRCHAVDLGGGFLVLDTVGWSLAQRDAPPYPSGRWTVAAAGWLADRYRAPGSVRLTRTSRAALLSGRRGSSEVAVGPSAIRSLSRSYWWNSRASRSVGWVAGGWGRVDRGRGVGKSP